MAQRNHGCIIAFVVAVFCLIAAALIGVYLVATSTNRAGVLLSDVAEREEPKNLEELNDYYEDSGPTNAANLYLEAFERLKGFEFDGRDLVSTEETLSPPYEPDAATHQAVRAFFDTQKETRQLLIDAEAQGDSRYPIDFEQAQTKTGFPHLQSVVDAGRFLVLDATVRAYDGDTDGATDSLVAAAGVVRSLRHEPTLIAHHLRAAMLSMVSDKFASVVSITQFDEQQLDRINGAIRDSYPAESLRIAMIGERAFALWGYESFGPLYVFDRSRSLRFFHDAIETADLPPSEIPKGIDRLRATFAKTPFPFVLYVLSSMSIGPQIGSMESHIRAPIQQDLATLVSNIERYRATSGSLPDSLAAISAESLIDPYANAPYQYKKTDSGYIVYSVGENRTDDGGDSRTDIVLEVTHPPASQTSSSE